MCIIKIKQLEMTGMNHGNDLPLPPPKGDKKGKWSSSIPLWRG